MSHQPPNIDAYFLAYNEVITAGDRAAMWGILRRDIVGRQPNIDTPMPPALERLLARYEGRVTDEAISRRTQEFAALRQSDLAISPADLLAQYRRGPPPWSEAFDLNTPLGRFFVNFMRNTNESPDEFEVMLGQWVREGSR